VSYPFLLSGLGDIRGVEQEWRCEMLLTAYMLSERYKTRSKTVSADTSEQMNREWEVRGSPLSELAKRCYLAGVLERFGE
jgi:hypothetical protein